VRRAPRAKSTANASTRADAIDIVTVVRRGVDGTSRASFAGAL
jgi:hypothetical protein